MAQTGDGEEREEWHDETKTKTTVSATTQKQFTQKQHSRQLNCKNWIQIFKDKDLRRRLMIAGFFVLMRVYGQR